MSQQELRRKLCPPGCISGCRHSFCSFCIQPGQQQPVHFPAWIEPYAQQIDPRAQNSQALLLFMCEKCIHWCYCIRAFEQLIGRITHTVCLTQLECWQLYDSVKHRGSEWCTQDWSPVLIPSLVHKLVPLNYHWHRTVEVRCIALKLNLSNFKIFLIDGIMCRQDQQSRIAIVVLLYQPIMTVFHDKSLNGITWHSLDRIANDGHVWQFFHSCLTSIVQSCFPFWVGGSHF